MSTTRFRIDVLSKGILLDVPFGMPDVFGTAAYWAMQHDLVQGQGWRKRPALGKDLREELVGCLLGGYGVPAEIAQAAFVRVCGSGAISRGNPPTEVEILGLLNEPLTVGSRRVRYRFAAQRAQRISKALLALHRQVVPPPETPRALRDWLMELPGVGPKTASWIVRNRTGTCDVAIIDIHVHRAGTLAGVFLESWKPATDYDALEESFTQYCTKLGLNAAVLDTVIWEQMRVLGKERLPGPGQQPRIRHL